MYGEAYNTKRLQNFLKRDLIFHVLFFLVQMQV